MVAGSNPARPTSIKKGSGEILGPFHFCRNKNTAPRQSKFARQIFDHGPFYMLWEQGTVETRYIRYRPVADSQWRDPVFRIADGQQSISSQAIMQCVVAVGKAYLRFAKLCTKAGLWGIGGSGIHLLDVVDPWRRMRGLALKQWPCFYRRFLVE